MRDLHIPKLGDPHLGRRFTKGVALDRRGERERLVREDFVRQLDPQGAEIHVCMGDLFDKPQVDYGTVLFAIQAYRLAASQNPRTAFWVLQGNHDVSRDLTEVAAWDIFCDAMRSVPNVHPVTKPMVGSRIALFPWHPTITAAEMVASVSEALCEGEPKIAFGHWDVDPRSSSHNLIPTWELAMCEVRQAFTGHVHKPDAFRRDGVDVTVVGSMQPYAQGEDGGQCGHVRYETLTLERLQEVMEVAPEALCNACVRVQLEPGQQWEGEIPLCRSWDIQRLQETEIEAAPADVSMEGFDTAAAAREALDAHEIIPEVREQIDTRWTETFGRAPA